MRPFSIVIAWLLSAGMAAADTFFDETVLPVLRRHCMDCHEPEDSEGDVIFLDAKRPADLEKRRVVWKSVAEQLRNRTMPPPKRASQPDELERMQVSEWIHHYLRQSASRSAPYAGWVKARRLNRTEYDHTIRDLLGVNLNFAETFPMEGGGGEGFDNNSETLFLPPLLMERFMEAAQQVADAAIVSPRLQRRFRPEELLPKEKPAVTGGRKLDGPGEVSLLLPVHVAGEFELRIEAGSGEGQVSELEISVDGIRTDTVRLAGGTVALPDAGPVRRSLRLTRGLHAVSFRSVGPGLIVLHAVEIEENRPSVGAERRASHRRLLGLDPGESPVALRALARERLEHMVERAFRRPLRAREVDRFMKLFDRATERGDSFEEGMKLALKGVLVSPEFLFRLEAPAKGAEIEPLGDFELASRLSYFLWSTMPDDALWQSAGSGRLRQEGGLKLEMDRMLKDPRSRVFARSFVGQWLGTKDVGGRVAPTQNAIQHFYTPEVAAAMREEIIRFFHELVLRDRSVLDLIDADYTYMSGRLAKFYERDDWKDFRMDEFEQVSLGDGRRGGLLGMGAVLALTSHFKQTSPILRGAWILDTLWACRCRRRRRTCHPHPRRTPGAGNSPPAKCWRSIVRTPLAPPVTT